MLDFALVDLPELSTMVPIVEQLGFGVVAGFVAGYALKKVGKVLALVLGLFFIGIQLLAWSGYLTIEWGRVQAEVEPLFAAESLDAFWRNLVAILTYNVPFAAAFVPGFLLGVRRG